MAKVTYILNLGDTIKLTDSRPDKREPFLANPCLEIYSSCNPIWLVTEDPHKSIFNSIKRIWRGLGK